MARFPRDKLHTKRFSFPIQLYLLAIAAHEEKSRILKPSSHHQEVQQSRRERARSRGAQSKAEPEEAQQGLPYSKEQCRAQVGTRERGMSASAGAGSARKPDAYGLWEVPAEVLGGAEWRSGSVLGP